MKFVIPASNCVHPINQSSSNIVTHPQQQDIGEQQQGINEQQQGIDEQQQFIDDAQLNGMSHSSDNICIFYTLLR
jgi:hypothetical protein